MSKVKNSRGRYWTPEELEEFALLLVDEENYFAANLQTLALKKLSNKGSSVNYIRSKREGEKGGPAKSVLTRTGGGGRFSCRRTTP